MCRNLSQVLHVVFLTLLVALAWPCAIYAELEKREYIKPNTWLSMVLTSIACVVTLTWVLVISWLGSRFLVWLLFEQ